MNRKVTLLAILMGLFLMGGPAFSEEILTNETVMTMIKAGLGEELIISKIKASQNQFDVTTDTILKLKNEGVSENVIKAMIEASKPKVSAPPDRSAVTKMIISDLFSLYLKRNEKMVAIAPIIPERVHSRKKEAIFHWGLSLPSSIYGPEDIWHFIRGERSITRTDNRKPLFYTKMNPSGFLLAKLAYQKKNDIRYVISKGQGKYNETIPIESKESSEGFFEIFLKEVLSPGEYAFVTRRGFYDFGVDPITGTESKLEASISRTESKREAPTWNVGDKLEAPIRNVGDKWKYRADNGMEWTAEIIGDEKDVYIERFVIPGGIKKGEWVRHFEKGSMHCVKTFRDGRIDREENNRVKKIYDFPLYAGKKWSYRFDVFSGTMTHDLLIELKIVGFEEVEVPAGKFNAFKVETKDTVTTGSGTGHSGTSYYWYSPDVKSMIKVEFLPSGLRRSIDYNKVELISFELK